MSNSISTSPQSSILPPDNGRAGLRRPGNTVILTSGLSGSSVLTGLISRAGYWTGDRVVEKKDYNTHENEELVKLNLSLFEKAGFRGEYSSHFSQTAIDRISALAGRIDVGPYVEFIEKCNARQPWIWKDPRLWMTIRFWRDLTDLQSCCFLLLTRGYFQSWVSVTKRRLIRSYGYAKLYERKIEDSTLAFLEENRLPYLHISYENLILQPEKCLARLNRFLGTSLTVEDLRATYHRPLYKSPGSSLPEVAKALLIYLKNYRNRADVRDMGVES